ncbi:MAG: NAD-dependent epimerase/dehydratase family protein [Mycoplasmataceae bacterium]|nr:NAD-dependent epimerase/dehydratase family protein [Mycoplasmataceae bacterium]
MKVLVNGGLGYIGSHAVYLLIEKGYDVIVLDNLTNGSKNNIHPKAKYYYEDIRYYQKVKDKDNVTKMQYIDFNFWLIGDILLKADKMSMANSLEVRVPFLDKPLIDYARKLPTKYKVDKYKTKKIFRDIARESLEDKVSDKKKLGFPVPIRVWMRENDVYNTIKNRFLKAEEFFDTNKIIKLLDEHKLEKKDNSRKIWTIYIFLLWYDIYFGR